MITVKSAQQKKRKRYCLNMLLKYATKSNIKALNKATAPARAGKPIGREKL
ncbi:MAG: hypothetical protein NTU49_05265 [Gammaproteobacteria bacterium]|nr:hypothetical protein [Gammaproteobacteria bacterium]